jgi:hypothetical protein
MYHAGPQEILNTSAYFFIRNMAFTTRINEVNMPSIKATRIMTNKVPKGINMILLLLT